MKCVRCGGAISDGAKFCPRCGCQCDSNASMASSSRKPHKSRLVAGLAGVCAAGLVVIAVLFFEMAESGTATVAENSDGAYQAVPTEDVLSDEDGESPNVDSGATDDSPVAATVNGVEIRESVITDYVTQFRLDSDLIEDAAWVSWMQYNEWDPEIVRSEVVNYYIDLELKKQLCAEYEVKITPEEIEEALDEVKAEFESEEAYLEALDASGVTEEEYREGALREQVEDEKLREVLLGSESDSEAWEEYFDGLRSGAEIVRADMPKGLPYDIEMPDM